MPRKPGRFKFSRRQVGIGVGVLAAVAVTAALNHWIDLPALHDRAKEFNGVVVFLCLTFLPLLGFPVSVLHAVAGAKFGLPLGMTLVGVSIAIQLCASYAIVHAAPKFFARHFDWLRKKLPPATHPALTLFTILFPGAPFFAQNYVLAVVGVPFRIFFWISFPLSFVRSLIGVIFGEWSGDMNPFRITILVVYGLVITLGCGLAFRRLRAQLKNRRPAAGGRKQPA